MVTQADFSALSGTLALPLAGFAIVTSATPGPVNVIAAASGMHFGWTRTMPHVVGATLGYAGLVLAMGLGFGTLIAYAPWVQEATKAVGMVFLIYLAWSLVRPGAADSSGTAIRCPPSVLQGVLLQWTNPKAWVVAASGVATYTLAGNGYVPSVMLQAAIFALVCPISIGAWAVVGHVAGGRLRTRGARLRFNRAMAFLLVLSIATLVI